MPQVYHLFIAWCLPVFITAYTCPTGTQSVSLSYLSGTANGSSLLALTTQNGDPNNGTGPTNLTYAAGAPVSLNTSVGVPPGIQVWTVQATGYYQIVAAGAAGGIIYGLTTGYGGTFYTDGYGAVVSTVYYFTAGQTVAVLVGQSPNACGNTTSTYSSGGGGTFLSIYNASGNFSNPAQHTLVLVAGGGGGIGHGSPGANAQTGTTGGVCNNPTNCNGIPATNGGGGGGGGHPGGNGAAGSSTSTANYAGGGGGFIGNGGNGYTGHVMGGISFLNGGVGGYAGLPTPWGTCLFGNGTLSVLPQGGFGGGGAGNDCGGGGGGYSGGQV